MFERINYRVFLENEGEWFVCWFKAGSFDTMEVYAPIYRLRFEIGGRGVDGLTIKGQHSQCGVASSGIFMVELYWMLGKFSDEWRKLDENLGAILDIPIPRTFLLFRSMTEYFANILNFTARFESIGFSTRTFFRFAGDKPILVKHILTPPSEFYRKIEVNIIDHANLEPLVMLLCRNLKYEIEPESALRLCRWWGKVLKELLIQHNKKVPQEINFYRKIS